MDRGRARAGDMAGSLHSGHAVEIATGAPLPCGADAVLPWNTPRSRTRE
nr:hypothetical protein [Saccharothrix luteola]